MLQPQEKQKFRSNLNFLDVIEFKKDWSRGWSRSPESNRRPTVYETVALPAELERQLKRLINLTLLLIQLFTTLKVLIAMRLYI